MIGVSFIKKLCKCIAQEPPEETPVCCLFDGTCVELNEEDCLAEGGSPGLPGQFTGCDDADLDCPCQDQNVNDCGGAPTSLAITATGTIERDIGDAGQFQNCKSKAACAEFTELSSVFAATAFCGGGACFFDAPGTSHSVPFSGFCGPATGSVFLSASLSSNRCNINGQSSMTFSAPGYQCDDCNVSPGGGGDSYTYNFTIDAPSTCFAPLSSSSQFLVGNPPCNLTVEVQIS